VKYRLLDVTYEEVPVANEERAQDLWEAHGGEGPRPVLVRVIESDHESSPVGSLEFWPRAMIEDRAMVEVVP
jgi:hypothetical protein